MDLYFKPYTRDGVLIIHKVICLSALNRALKVDLGYSLQAIQEKARQRDEEQCSDYKTLVSCVVRLQHLIFVDETARIETRQGVASIGQKGDLKRV